MDACFNCAPNEEDNIFQGSMSMEDKNSYFECDYDKDVTPLYQAIEEKAWVAVNQFLQLGYWPEKVYIDLLKPKQQARTWVTRYETRRDGSKKVRWSQLPLHAAIIFGAPSVIIEKLVEIFPNSIRCTDDHRMLPLHLSFRNGSPDLVIAMLLEAFPGALNCKGFKDMLPVDCAKDGPNVERALIIKNILQRSTNETEKKDAGQRLKELFHAKEATKIKGQKISNLNCFVKEIAKRKKSTEDELAHTLKMLFAVKNGDETANNKKKIQDLMDKVDALESVTKDLTLKETNTQNELKKTIGEFEKSKQFKPPAEQAEDFSKLQKVTSHEGATVLSSAERGVPSLDLGNVESETNQNLEVVKSLDDTNENTEEKIIAPSLLETNVRTSSKVVPQQASNSLFGSFFGSTEEQMNKETEANVPTKEKEEVNIEELNGVIDLVVSNNNEDDGEKVDELKKKTMKDRFFKTLGLTATNDLKKAASNETTDTTTSKESMKIAMKHIEKKAAETRGDLQNTMKELKKLKKESGNVDEKQVLKILTKKVELMQTNMGSLEAKENKTMKALGKSMKEIEKLSLKRLTLLEKVAGKQGATAEKTRSGELGKKATLEGKNMEEMEKLLMHLAESTAKTKKELTETKEKMALLHVQQMQKLEETPQIDLAEEKEAIKHLSVKLFSLQQAVVGFEVKETKTLKEMERTMRQLEELTAMRFDVLESANAKNLPEAAKLERLSAKEEKKAAALIVELKDVEEQVSRTRDTLNMARDQLEELNLKQKKGWKQFEALHAQQKKGLKHFEELNSKQEIGWKQLEQLRTKQENGLKNIEAQLNSNQDALLNSIEKELIPQQENLLKEQKEEITKQFKILQLKQEKDMQQFELQHQQREKGWKEFEEGFNLKQDTLLKEKQRILYKQFDALERKQKTLTLKQEDADTENKNSSWKLFESLLNTKQEELMQAKENALKKEFEKLHVEQFELLQTEQTSPTLMQQFGLSSNISVEQIKEKQESLKVKFGILTQKQEELFKSRQEMGLKLLIEQIDTRQDDLLQAKQEQLKRQIEEITTKQGKLMIAKQAALEAKQKSLFRSNEKQEGVLKKKLEDISSQFEELNLKQEEIIQKKQSELVKQFGELNKKQEDSMKAKHEELNKEQLRVFERQVELFRRKREEILKLPVGSSITQLVLNNFAIKQEELRNQLKGMTDKISQIYGGDVKGGMQDILEKHESVLERMQKEHEEVLKGRQTKHLAVIEAKQIAYDQELMKKEEEFSRKHKELLRKQEEIVTSRNLQMHNNDWKNAPQSPVNQGIIDSLTYKVSQLQETVLSFETKEAENMHQIQKAIKKVEDVSDKKFRDLVLSASPKVEFSDSTIKLSIKDIERKMEEIVDEKLVSSPRNGVVEKLELIQKEVAELKTKSGFSTGKEQIAKIAALESAIDRIKEKSTVIAADDWRITELQKELNEVKVEAKLTKEQLDETKIRVEEIQLLNPEKQILDLNEKITKLQEDVIGFEAQEQQTMQELEETMVHLEELTAKRVHVLENVQEQKEAVKSSEIQKLQRKNERDEKKILDLETAMARMTLQAKYTREELDMTMKALEEVEAKQATSKVKASVSVMEEKHTIDDLTKQVSKLQSTVAMFEEHENKTSVDLEKTKDELKRTVSELHELKSDDALLCTKDMIQELKKIQAEVLQQAKDYTNPEKEFIFKIDNNNNDGGESISVEVEVDVEARQTVEPSKLSFLEKNVSLVMKKLNDARVKSTIEEKTEEMKDIPPELPVENQVEMPDAVKQVETKQSDKIKKKNKRNLFSGLFGKRKSQKQRREEKKTKKSPKQAVKAVDEAIIKVVEKNNVKAVDEAIIKVVEKNNNISMEEIDEVKLEEKMNPETDMQDEIQKNEEDEQIEKMEHSQSLEKTDEQSDEARDDVAETNEEVAKDELPQQEFDEGEKKQQQNENQDKCEDQVQPEQKEEKQVTNNEDILNDLNESGRQTEKDSDETLKTQESSKADLVQAMSGASESLKQALSGTSGKTKQSLSEVSVAKSEKSNGEGGMSIKSGKTKESTRSMKSKKSMKSVKSTKSGKSRKSTRSMSSKKKKNTAKMSTHVESSKVE